MMLDNLQATSYRCTIEKMSVLYKKIKLHMSIKI